MGDLSPRKKPTLGAYIFDAKQRTSRMVKRSLQRNLRNVAGQKVQRSRRANNLVAEKITANSACLISRLGTTEGELLRHFLQESQDGTCRFPPHLSQNMRTNSGFFPESDELLSRFCRESLTHLENVDILGVRAHSEEKAFWELESYLISETMESPTLVDIEDLSPVASAQPWTKSLAGKKVLVIHPFADTIQSQYEVRDKLFPDPNFLPDFQLTLLKAVQSAGDNQSEIPFGSWFDALDHMREEIRSTDFDVALIGAGAYGLFLGDTCKAMGKTAIHIGGATQLLFGIFGRRWTEERNASSQFLRSQINEFWTTASGHEIPKNERSVEGGGYWV